jgi:hypothetical protein
MKVWTIEQMQCFPSLDGKQNVVYVVNWLLTATQDEHTVQIYNTANLEYAPGSPYTEYDKLTPEQVLGWVKNALGNDQVHAYEVEADELLAKKAAPQLVTNGLPWAKQEYEPIKLY